MRGGVWFASLLFLFGNLLAKCTTLRQIGIGVEVYNMNLINHISIAAAMACRHINEKVPSLVAELQNLPDGFNVTCEFARTGNQQSGVRQALEWAEQGFLGIVGPASSIVAGPLSIVAAASGPTPVPVVSYWADSPLLKDKGQYPNFARTIPSSDLPAYATVRVMQELGWTHFAFIYSAARSEWFQALAEAAAQDGVSLVTAQKYELQESDEDTYHSILAAATAVAHTGVRVIIEAVDYSEFPHLVRAAAALGLTGPGIQWLSPNRPQATTVLSRGDILGVPERDVYEFLRGELTVATEPFGGAANAERYHAVERQENQTELFGALLPDVIRFDLETHTCLGICGYMYDAVAALALAAARAEGAGRGGDSEAVLEELRGVEFAGASGQVAFDASMDRASDHVTFAVFTQLGAATEEGGLVMHSVPIGTFVFGAAGLERFHDADFEWSGGERGWARILKADKQCQAGYEFSLDTLSCEACTEGTSSAGGGAPCAPCARGSYSPESAMERCLPCGESSYAAEEGLTSCSECPAFHRIKSAGDGDAVLRGTKREDCACTDGFHFNCTMSTWQVVVLVLGVAAMLGAGLLTLLRGGEQKAEPEEELVRRRALRLRETLGITRTDGFVTAGEIAPGGAVRFNYKHLEALARMSLLLDWEPRHVDALAAILQYGGARERSDSLSSTTTAGSFSSTRRTRQYLALVQTVLDQCKLLLNPLLDEGGQHEQDHDMAWAQPAPASDRFRFLTDKVGKLRLWEEHDNFLSLQGVAQLFMDVHRKSCDALYDRIRLEEGGQALIGLAGPAPKAEWTRQDSAHVQAVPVVEAMLQQVLVRAKSHDAFDGFSVCDDDEDDDHDHDAPAHDVVVETGSSPPAAQRRAAMLESWIFATCNSRAWARFRVAVDPERARSDKGRTSSTRWLPRLFGLKSRGSDDGEESLFRELQASLKALSRTKHPHAHRDLSDEEPFVQFLASRASLLDNSFQAKVASLPFRDVSPSLDDVATNPHVAPGMSSPHVQAGPVKSKQRMMEKVVAYRTELEDKGGGRGAYPLAAQILDPVRASIVCSGPTHVVEIASWLLSEGERLGLPVVRVKNKFSVPTTDSDGYRDLMLSVVFTGEEGLKIIGEVQLHDARMFEIKVKMHRLYKVKRAASAKTIF